VNLFHYITEVLVDKTRGQRYLTKCASLRNDLYCVSWGVKLYSIQSSVQARTLKQSWFQVTSATLVFTLLMIDLTVPGVYKKT